MGFSFGRQTERKATHSIDVSHVTALRVTSESGNVTIVSSAGASGAVDYTRHDPKYGTEHGHCRGNDHVDGTTLVVDLSQDSNATCSLEATIHVPPLTTIDIDAKISDIEITLGYSPTSGTLNATTAMGNIKLGMPEGTAFKLTESHGHGKFASELNADANAPFAVALNTKDGDVQINKN